MMITEVTCAHCGIPIEKGYDNRWWHSTGSRTCTAAQLDVYVAEGVQPPEEVWERRERLRGKNPCPAR